MENHRIIVGDTRQIIRGIYDPLAAIITSPPYWNIKDYGDENQLGFGQRYTDYLSELSQLFTHIVVEKLIPSGWLCIDIGDVYVRRGGEQPYNEEDWPEDFRVVPLAADLTHALSFTKCLVPKGTVIWKKQSTIRPSGGISAGVMGSYPYPRDPIPSLQNEYILLFRKVGKTTRPDNYRESEITRERWKELQEGIWSIPGAPQKNGMAIFPLEIPRRLIEAHTFKGETVLDPFLGSGTTMQAAHELGRRCIGVEINPDLIDHSKLPENVEIEYHAAKTD